MSKTWYCYNKACRAPLGQVVRGELVLDRRSPHIGAISTDEAFLVVMCNDCGKLNRWIPHDSKLVKAFIGTHLVTSLIESVKDAWSRAMVLPEDDECEDED